jgi:ZIP family zinc transporter
VLSALGWGALATSALVLGAVLGVVRPWPDRVVGIVLGLGAGALISAVSFELAGDGLREAGFAPVAVGLAVGALTFFLLDGAVDRFAQRRAGTGGVATSLVLGSVLDGVPEMLVLGVQLSRGEGVSVALIAAIFLENLPEAMGSARELVHSAGLDRRRVALLWIGIAVVLAACTPLGMVVADNFGPGMTAGFNGFAAGALLVMLATSLVPEEKEKGGRVTGLATTLGYALAVALSVIGS